MEKNYSNIEVLREQQVDEPRDICGLCGLPGADKIPHPIHWPGERIAGTELVHTECEAAECARASALCQGKAQERAEYEAREQAEYAAKERAEFEDPVADLKVLISADPAEVFYFPIYPIKPTQGAE